jgi:hypothetical protein
VILYLKDPKKLYPKTLIYHNRYSKVAGCKIILKKSLAFLYTNNELTEKEYMETIPFTIASKKSNILFILALIFVYHFYTCSHVYTLFGFPSTPAPLPDRTCSALLYPILLKRKHNL